MERQEPEKSGYFLTTPGIWQKCNVDKKSVEINRSCKKELV